MTQSHLNPLPPEANAPGPPKPPDPDSMSMLRKLDVVLDAVVGAIDAWSAQTAAAAEPPERTPVHLTSARPRYAHTSGKNCLSIGVRNAGPVSVWLSIGGETPQRGTGAIEIPAGALIVTPTPARDIHLAVDQDDRAEIPAQGFSIDVYRYWTVQPAAAYHLPPTIVATGGSSGSGSVDGGTP